MAALTKRGLTVLGIGACAACCAIPIAGLLGLGVGSGIGIVAWQWLQAEWWCLILVLLGVSGLVMFKLQRSRRHHQAESDCEDACDVEQRCCGSEAETAVPTGCTLTENEFDRRLQAIKAMLKKSLIRVSREDTSVKWVLRYSPEVLVESQQLAALESQCCGDLRFQVERHGEEIQWTIAGGNYQLLHTFEQLPRGLNSESPKSFQD